MYTDRHVDIQTDSKTDMQTYTKHHVSANSEMVLETFCVI